jgi:hypothetical protein
MDKAREGVLSGFVGKKSSAATTTQLVVTVRHAMGKGNASQFCGSHWAFRAPLHRNVAPASAARGFEMSTAMGTALAKQRCFAVQTLWMTRYRLRLRAPSLPYLKTSMVLDTPH